MQRNDENDTPTKEANREFFRMFFLGILFAMVSSAIECQIPPRPGASEAAVRAIIARHDSAAGRIGGRSPHQHSHTIMEVESSAGFKSVIETWMTTPDRILTRMTMPGGAVTEFGYNGSVGWTTTPFTGSVLLGGDALKQLTKQAEGRAIHETKFKTMAAGAPTGLEGKRVVPVTYEDDKGNAGTLYFDATTGLMHAMRTRSPDSTNAIPEMLMVVGDYKRFDRELIATKWTMTVGQMTTVTRTTLVDHRAIDTALFIPPPAVRDLLRKP